MCKHELASAVSHYDPKLGKLKRVLVCDQGCGAELRLIEEVDYRPEFVETSAPATSPDLSS